MTSDEYDAVVYDLDGTLVRLDVDWDAVAADVEEALEAQDVDTSGKSLWEMLDLSNETGHRNVVEEQIAAHEQSGARTSRRLPLADELPLDVPVGVCSLNCESACRDALEVHAISEYVDAVTGRDTLDLYKPDPEPLVELLDEFDVEPSSALFVGDSESDEVAAERAGMDFQWVEDRLSTE